MIKLGVDGFSVNDNSLITGRSCIIAQSGAGKSYGLAVICEALAKVNLGFCVIDTEGEYYSLREKFNVLLLGGKGADINVSSVNFKVLASRLISEGVPVIFDVSELSNAKQLIDDFINQLYLVASELRRPYLLIIEEADRLIPQKGDKLAIIGEIARRGRKRGLGLMLASQRPALIDKSVLSQCSYFFIGKLTVDNDLKSVSHLFDSRNELKSLPDLSPGDFFAVGFNRTPSLMKFRERETVHSSITPVITDRLPSSINELINDLSNSGPGVKPLISIDNARSSALLFARKKFVIAGKSERLVSLELINKPVVCFSLSLPGKKGVINFNSYITNDSVIIDELFRKRFDLSFINELNDDEVSSLIALLYCNARTISELISCTGLSDDIARSSIKGLVSKGFIKHDGWKREFKKFSVIKEVVIPKVTSLKSGEIITSVPVSDSVRVNIDSLKRIIKLLDSNVTIKDAKVIYYPLYKAVLELDGVSRELFINGVTGKLV